MPNSRFSLYLYFPITNMALSLVLVLEIDKVQWHVYVISKVLIGTKVCCQKIGRLTLVVVMTARNLMPYFQGQRLLVKTGYFVCQVLKKPDLVGRMVLWIVEWSKYDIQYIPRGNI